MDPEAPRAPPRPIGAGSAPLADRRLIRIELSRPASVLGEGGAHPHARGSTVPVGPAGGHGGRVVLEESMFKRSAPGARLIPTWDMAPQ